MENCLNKAELLEKFNLCYDSLNKILDYLKLPFEIKTSANYKKVPYYNQESINKIEELLQAIWNTFDVYELENKMSKNLCVNKDTVRKLRKHFNFDDSE